MTSDEQLIKLGKVLAEEQRRGCDNRAVVGGLERFLDVWLNETHTNTMDDVSARVQAPLRLLHGYSTLSLPERQQRLDQVLVDLRALYREQKALRTQQSSDQTSVLTMGYAGTSPDQPAYEQSDADTKLPGTTVMHTDNVSDTLELCPPPATPAHQPRCAGKTFGGTVSFTLATPIKELPGIGRTVALAFKRLGLLSVEDLLYHFPHRYDDYSSQKPIALLTIGEVETVVGTISEVKTFPLKRKGGVGINVVLEDESGQLSVVFFGNHWVAKQFTIGRKIVVSGKVSYGKYGECQMSSPDWEPYSEDERIHTGRLVPVHPLTKGLHERNARQIIKNVVDQANVLVVDYLPDAVRKRVNVLPLDIALQQMHFPDDQQTLQQAQRRIGFDEFLFIQLGVIGRKMVWQSELGYALTFFDDVHTHFLAQLPFKLTGAQGRALDEIFADIGKPVPMARLLQGDVGSGKTVVAAAALVQAIANGLQGALMAPTEILAEQHYRGLRKVLQKVRVPRDHRQTTTGDDPLTSWKERVDQDDLKRLDEMKLLLGMTPEEDMDGEGIRVALLTGGLGKKERRMVVEGIEKGDVDLVVGTHALITESVRYHALGLVCIDEQHRFGVEQRNRLKQKGFNPHMLVMTATPIPRTLTMTLYGELDSTILDELPPGRQEIRTRWIRRSERDKAYRHIRKEIGKGRQAFVICPLVEESEKVDLPSAEEMYELLQQREFPDFRVGLIHGRMLPREKDDAMRAFSNHEFDILVATAVVEVGIDVPNATTIMIDGAERFGLAQLHQFRGRVGRGVHQSYCILVSDKENEITTQRLEAMEQSTDGFELAEIDLRLRGPGEFFGKRQSGTPDLKVARLADTRLLHTARLEAQTILNEDPQLENHLLLKEKVAHFWEQAEGAS